MTNVRMSPPFKGHAVHKEFLSVERPSPEGAGSSAYDSRTAPWTGFAPGSLPTPLSHTLMRSKCSKESLNGCREYNTIRSVGTQRHAGHLCKKCISYFNIFKGEAFKQIIDGNLSTKDPKLPIHLYESMKTPAGAVETWSNVDGHCSICSTHLSQLKQEAIRTILSQDRAIWTGSSSANDSSTSLDFSQTLPRSSRHRPAGSKPHQRTANDATDCWIKEQQHLEALRSTSSYNGIHSGSQKTSLSPLHAQVKPEKESPSTTLCNYNASEPSRASSMSSLLPAGTSAAMSFIVRAVQKLNVMVKRGRQCSESGAAQQTTNFCSLLQKFPPPTPANFFQSSSKSKETPGMGKVKVILRVCPVSPSDSSQFHSVKLDLRKKQITVLNVTTSEPYTQSTGTAFSPKTFAFDAVFGHDSTQAEVCESSLCDLLQCVLTGTDGCILSFGQTSSGMSYTMIGHDGCAQTVGIIPCAISWLFKLINRKRDKTWANISVSVTAVEVCGENNAIRDLLSEVDADNCKETYKPDAYLVEDPIYGTQLCNHSVLNAPTQERAAFLLDAAIASRNSGIRSSGSTLSHSCHMFFTLHVNQQHIGTSTKSGMNVDQSKLSLISLGSCVGEKDSGMCLGDLGNIIIAKLNRHKHVPNKGSKLAMLLQDALSNINCTTTIIGHISTSSDDLTETLCTMQTASRIRRVQKRTRNSSSSSPGGGSSGTERRAHHSTRLRTFQSTGTLDQDLSCPGFFAEPEFRPGSAKSFDSVLDSSSFLNKEVTNRSREVLPIIPSILKSKLESKKLSIMKLCDISPPLGYRMKQVSKEKDKEELTPTLLQERSDFECLKCNTFAELQNRLGNIDIDKERPGLVGMGPCKGQSASTIIKAPHSGHAEKKSILTEAQATNKKESDSTRQGSSPRRFAVIQNNDEMKTTVDSLIVQTCSPQLDAVKQCDHMVLDLSSSRSQPNTEKADMMSISLPLRFEDQNMPSYDSTIQPDKRISPAGKSAPRSTSSSSFCSSVSTQSGSQNTVFASVNEDVVHNTLKHREMKATITVTVQQPLDLNGQDELVYTVVEEVTINGGNEKGKAKILSLHNSPSLHSLTSGGRPPVRIIGSVGQEHTTSFLNSGTEEQSSENEIAMTSSDDMLNEKSHVQPTKTNSNIDNNVSSINSEVLLKRAAWSHVPLTEDVKDIATGGKDGPSHNRSTHNEVFMSRQCDSTNKSKDLKDVPHLHTEFNNPHSPKETLERKQYVLKKQTTENVPLPSTSRNSPNEKRKIEKKQEYGISRNTTLNQRQPLSAENKTPKSPAKDSGKLFNAKLKVLSSRSQTLDLGESGASFDYPLTGSLEGICTSPRLKRGNRFNMPVHSSSMDAAGFKEEFDNFVMCRASKSLGRVPTFFPMHDVDANDTRPSKMGRSHPTISNKMPSSKIHRIPGNSPKSSSQNLSPKSMNQSINRSSSLSCNGSSSNQSPWSTHSLSRSHCAPSTKPSGLPLKGRIELLRSSRDSLNNCSQGGSDLDETEEYSVTKPSTHSLPSPYSWITAPRKPYHCSGHASDTTSVLSGELPPAMCKTALLYNRSSMVSSGYDSMLRDSEATISSSSTHNSISDQSCILSAARGVRSNKKRTNIGSSPRALSQDSLLTLKRSFSGSKLQWADRGLSESYEIKRMVRFSAKLKFLEHRQQRIAEVRSKYTFLTRELELAKQHLMVDPGKWTREFDLWQTFEVDSLEHLEALEVVTERLERHVNLCKSHILMVTCFDDKPKRRQKCRHRPSADHKGFVEI
ncbi:kinesin-like protein KIF26B isoform X2 [Triplophysa dalaica]|uniref:kinesin-like protein KIF26B isoform X2 n=1 Tax=Triplophysa dalaica TaxID=1582913 RepID=UPI0024DFCE0F|nr:kinesin-like protein KIF26B isoform X2 [Triplophysa dalaica]